MKQRYDVIVVGLGHAGCEAALACARMGLDTLGLTLKRERAAVMSCNPAVGGTAKGHLVRELDALGGEMGRVADLAGTHFKTLNASKGPAVQATRVLCDREAYARTMQSVLWAQPGPHRARGRGVRRGRPRAGAWRAWCSATARRWRRARCCSPPAPSSRR